MSDLSEERHFTRTMQALQSMMDGSTYIELIYTFESGPRPRIRTLAASVWANLRAESATHCNVLELLIHNSFLDPLLTVLPGDGLATPFASPDLYSLLRDPIIAVLLRFGLDPNISSSRGIPLGAIVAQTHSRTTFLLLIIAGMNLDARNVCASLDPLEGTAKFGLPPTFRATAKHWWPTLAWDAPRTEIRRQCAELIRRHFPERINCLLDGLILHKIP